MKRFHPEQDLPTPTARGGFTLIEVLVATFVFLAAAALALTAYVTTARHGREGTQHVNLIDHARIAEQQIARFIQRGRAVSADEDRLTIMMPDLKQARIQFIDPDGDPDTVEDNHLLYDPDVNAAGGEERVCEMVSALPSEPMFRILPSSPRTAMLAFHVGEVPDADEEGRLLPGQGYQGVEMRISATPRNLGTVY